jgi:hypothetical protein
MDRELNPVFAQARSVLERALDAAGFTLSQEWYGPQSFGSTYADYRNGHRRVKLLWDGKDGFLILLGAYVTARIPEPREWQPLLTQSSPLSLRPGPEADAWINAMADALNAYLAQVV